MKNAASVLLGLWLVLSALYGGSRPTLGGDLWWSLAAGRHISDVGSVPDVDIFSHAAEGEPWANQEWLFQVLVYRAFDTLGPAGLVWAKILVVVGFALLLAYLIARRSDSAFLGVSLAAGVLLVWGENIDLRAQLFTFLGTVALLLFLNAYRAGMRAAAFGPPLLLLVWVDLHYGFIFGLAVVFGYFVAETTKSILHLPSDPMPIAESRRLGWVFLASVLACALNPQGIHALTFPFDILDASSPWDRIVEWRPPRLVRNGLPEPFVWAIAIQVPVAATAAWRVPHRFDFTEFGLVTVTAVMAYTSRRFVPLFAIVGAPFLARNLMTIGRDLAAQKSHVWRMYRERGMQVAVGVGAIGTLWVGPLAIGHLRELSADGLFDRMTHAERFPIAATRFLEDNPFPGNLYNFYPWGGYLAFHLGRQIYIDGRAHAVYPDEMYHESKRTDAIEVGWRKTLNRRAIDVVVHRADYPLPLKLRANPGWVRVYDDGYAAVLVRRTEQTAELLSAFDAGDLRYPDTPGARAFVAERTYHAGQRQEAVAALVEVLQKHQIEGEKALVSKALIEKAAMNFTPDPKAKDTVEAIEAALARYDRAHLDGLTPAPDS